MRIGTGRFYGRGTPPGQRRQAAGPQGEQGPGRRFGSGQRNADREIDRLQPVAPRTVAVVDEDQRRAGPVGAGELEAESVAGQVGGGGRGRDDVARRRGVVAAQQRKVVAAEVEPVGRIGRLAAEKIDQQRRLDNGATERDRLDRAVAAAASQDAGQLVGDGTTRGRPCPGRSAGWQNPADT